MASHIFIEDSFFHSAVTYCLFTGGGGVDLIGIFVFSSPPNLEKNRWKLEMVLENILMYHSNVDYCSTKHIFP